MASVRLTERTEGQEAGGGVVRGQPRPRPGEEGGLAAEAMAGREVGLPADDPARLAVGPGLLPVDAGDGALGDLQGAGGTVQSLTASDSAPVVERRWLGASEPRLTLTERALRPTRSMAQRDPAVVMVHVDDLAAEERWVLVMELLLEAGETESTEAA